MKSPERRFTKTTVAIQTRAEGAPKVAAGYAAVFYRKGDPATQYPLWQGCVERIHAGAFDRALAEGDDVRGLFNHDPSQLLGRTASKTLRLAVDEKGLSYENDLADTTVARDVAIHLERRDVTGSSFSFNPEKVEWTTEKTDDGVMIEVRNIYSVRLFDVGPVTFPAYEGTEANTRSLQEERSAFREAQEAPDSAAETDSRRLRAAMLRLR
jgi:HK97 family phage prohead protease